ncbi:MAG: serine/threonine-protein phosphatase [Prevotella sp.]|jgi:protein phosphatase|nr:serine/threonine-protein phosphatase [Prevotella sp.]
MDKFSITAASHVGCIRSNNEDMILVWDRFIRNDSYRTEIYPESINRFVIAVADGMGGHNAGEVASQQAIENLRFFIDDLPVGLSSGDLNEMMAEWLKSINKSIEGRGLSDPSLADMGTTLVGIIYYEHKFYWMNCGDSRLYRLRDGQLTQLSTDHSLNNMMGTKKHSNIITNCIGGGCRTSFIDMFEFTSDVKTDDTYILCSDGLNDMVDDKHIEALADQQCSASEFCRAAIDAGGYDNVSVCVIKVM